MNVLETDPVFKKKLEESNVSDIKVGDWFPRDLYSAPSALRSTTDYLCGVITSWGQKCFLNEVDLVKNFARHWGRNFVSSCIFHT